MSAVAGRQRCHHPGITAPAVALLLVSMGAGLAPAQVSGPTSTPASRDPAEAASTSIPSPPIIGMTEPHETVVLASIHQGVISAVAVHEGDEVRRGQEIVLLDDSAQRKRTEIAQAAAESTLDVELARCTLEQAERELQRIQNLADSTSPKELNDARTAAETARLAHRIAQLEHDQALRRHESERLQLDELRLRAPFNGYVREIHKHAGAAVDELEPIVTLVQLDPLVVAADCPLTLAHQIAVGQEVLVRPMDARWKPRVGRVALASRVADPASQTFRVKIEVANEDGGWMAGLKMEIAWGENKVATAPGAGSADRGAVPDKDSASRGEPR